jgi:hypothetical protein
VAAKSQRLRTGLGVASVLGYQQELPKIVGLPYWERGSGWCSRAFDVVEPSREDALLGATGVRELDGCSVGKLLLRGRRVCFPLVLLGGVSSQRR